MRDLAGPIVVFVGPTIAVDEARATLEAVYLPPAEQGSVYAAFMDFRPRIMAIIDGAFQQVPAVRHKEILWAIANGVVVFGAASMGALRAVELEPFGMRGVGLIYRWLRRAVLADDDEVAVSVSPAALGSRPLSEALINMRLTLRRAELSCVISGTERRALERRCTELHFSVRSYERLFETANAALPGLAPAILSRIAAWVRDHRIDQKHADAIALLRTISDSSRHAKLQQSEGIGVRDFPVTETWVHDLAAAGLDPEPVVGSTIQPSLRDNLPEIV